MTSPVVVADRYECLRPLGRGTFARTWLARDRKLGRQVTLKVLQPRPEDGVKAFELFEREAAVLRELRHSGIPAIHTTFRAPWEGADSAFLVMEYIEGASLAELIVDRRHLEQAEVVHLVVELLGVLDYLHTRVPPVLHRDIKPANIIVRTEGSPVLVDFGAVRNVFRAPDEEGSTVVGTYGYMPYEQYMGQAGPTSDLYALGATFLHLLTGRPPPEFMSSAGRLEVPATLPCGEPLRGVLARLLAPSPTDRIPSARLARAALVGGAAVPVPSTALTSPDPDNHPARFTAPIELAPAPRPVDPQLLDRLAFTPWQLMETSSRGKVEHGFGDVVLFVFFSVITAGVLPAIFWSIARSRRKRLRKFLAHGIPGTARVLDMQDEKTAFDEKLSRVRYEFDIDGRRIRGSDQVLPAIAERWERGDTIQILYLPDDDFDSVILSTT